MSRDLSLFGRRGRVCAPEPGEGTRGTPSLGEYCKAIRAGDRRAMARAITLIESSRPDQAELGQAILEALVPETGKAIRVGITGPPGVGKSTLIEALGLYLVSEGLSVAVLAVDPSSPVTGGSILGDKTRMERLATSSEAFIRPSPSGGSLGGVAHRSREVMLLCEAAGYDVVLVETVGIGQSEVTVASMVDFFLVLLLPAGGDQLQGIKRGVMELADCLAINKADGELRAVAERTRADYEGALQLIRPTTTAWRPRALLVSALEEVGVAEIWAAIGEHRDALMEAGQFEARRREQNRDWMWNLVEQGLRGAMAEDPTVAGRVAACEEDVQAQRRSPAAAARELLAAFQGGKSS
ncbi:MAG: methylmalonyl Co-A mutase-associated GTPase MeaB [Myxococcota bacterium]|nr:methylmalonyl Co-A mutase-associated GTPase MeaB [Myxococcota bacterium]